jgi:glycosyltransferase involved in cell wall biosynthesis
MKTAVFSIVSPNYRHYARVLMTSLQRHEPEWERFVLVVGETAPATAVEPFTTVQLESLALPQPRKFFFRYTLLELNTAVKPWMFEHLFAMGFDRVIYLDPDIFVYSPLVELDEASPDRFLTLTPHLTGSIAGDDHPSERTILQAGSYNLGFLAVRRQPQLERFLSWWQEKLERQCIVDVAHGLFVDQKWIDLTPGLFAGVGVLRHDGYNVAYWNLSQRRVTADGDGFTVNGQPLRFFHFSGFDPARPQLVSRHDPRQRASDAGDAAPLLAGYAEAVRSAGYTVSRNAPYAFAQFSDGSPLPDAARYSYRNSPELEAAAGDDPFEHPELFLTVPQTRGRTPVSARAAHISYMFLSRARPLVRLLPRSLRQSMREFLLGRKDLVRAPSAEENTLPPGINVVGVRSRDTGIGESARLFERSCERAGIATHSFDLDATSRFESRAVYRASIYHMNADQMPLVHAQLPAVFETSAYNIGCWHWELPELPDAWIGSAQPLDEIWAPSAFVQSAVSNKVTIPVVHMPHGVEVTQIEPCSLQDLGVPRGKFVFLCMFDLGSVVERKNPLAAVEAFRRAFPAASDAMLLMKVAHSSTYTSHYRTLEEQLHGIPGVHLTDRMFTRAGVNGLIAACDAVVSLHRSEGFGLILAEAMDLGKPVIATGWSGNMDFMNSGNSCPVAYELVTLDRAYPPYEAGQQWAEPDVDHAAHLMRRIYEDAEWRTRIGERATHTIRSEFSPDAAGRRYRKRLEFLGLLAPDSHKPQ